MQNNFQYDIDKLIVKRLTVEKIIMKDLDQEQKEELLRF